MDVYGRDGKKIDLRDKFKNKNLRDSWKKVKKGMLSELKKHDEKEYKALKREFDKGLGPLLDKWSREVGKFPKHDPKKVGEIGHKIQGVMKHYETAFRKVSDTFLRGTLETALDGIAHEMNRQLKWYANPKLF